MGKITISKPSRKIIICSALFSVLYSLCFSVGNAMYDSGSTASFFSDLPGNLGNWLLCFVLTFSVTTVIYSISVKNEPAGYAFDRCNYKPFLFVLGIFFILCWLPAYRSYYPGMTTYDFFNQLYQTYTQYDTHHPPLHTFLLQIFIKPFNYDYSKGLPIFDFCQMVFLAYVFCSTVKYMIDYKAPLWVVLVSVIFYALNPVLAMFVSIPVKDVLFGGILLLFLLKFRELLFHTEQFLSEKGNIVSYIVLGLVFCLLRNNAVYVLLVLAPVLLWFVRKNNRRNALCMIYIAPVILFLFVSTFVYNLLGISKGDFVEFLSVPLQQISRVVKENEDSVSAGDRETISSFLAYDEIGEKYNRRLSDPIKEIFDGTYGVKPVVVSWLSLLRENIALYADAFLDLYIPYWYVRANGQDPVSGVPYIETNYDQFWELGQGDTLADKILYFYEDVADYVLFEDIPFFINIFSLSFPLWSLTFLIFFFLAKNRSCCIIWIAIPFLFLCTYFLGPVCNCRYIVPIIMTYPVLLFFLVDSATFFISPRREHRESGKLPEGGHGTQAE